MKLSSKQIEKELGGLIREKINESLSKSGKLPPIEQPQTLKTAQKKQNQKQKIQEAKKAVTSSKNKLNEALVTTPKAFVLKTEKMSSKTKEAHEILYKKYVDTFNKVSSELDAVNKQSANSFSSLYRSFKMDECYNLNAIKLHELYWNNISDLASDISVDSLPYMKFSRDWGTFEEWQFDFMACAMSAKEGWAMTVYEPYKNVYMNVCIDGHDVGIPVGSIPIVVMDMWSHAFFKDYQIDKKSYLIAMMRELNWDVIEARMAVAERSDIDAVYAIKPMYNNNPEKLIDKAEEALKAPIDDIKDSGSTSTKSGMVEPSTPPPAQPPEPGEGWGRGY